MGTWEGDRSVVSLHIRTFSSTVEIFGAIVAHFLIGAVSESFQSHLNFVQSRSTANILLKMFRKQLRSDWTALKRFLTAPGGL